jgi:hypothetical protein
MIKVLVGAVGATIFGNLVWILGLVNFIWLLVKDYKLFSWWWVVGSLISFLICLGIYF